MTHRKKTKKKLARRSIHLIVLAGFFILIGAAATFALLAERKLASLALGGLGERFSTTVYGRSRESGQPVLLATLSGNEKVKRDPITWDEIPPVIVDAVTAIEDHSFFSHHGLKITSLVRATIANIQKKRFAEGGSTITQQLAKNFFLSPRKTIHRKFLEMGFALYLDLRLSKEKIMTLYLNHIYWGQDGATSICGIRAAARHYFNKDVQNLTLSDTAALAGMIQSPLRYNPLNNMNRCRSRRNMVLKRMLDLNLITTRQYRSAKSSAIIVNPSLSNTQEERGYDYYVSEVVRRLTPIWGDALYTDGLVIQTPCDPELQRSAEQTLKSAPHQAAMVSIDPKSGSVLALVGGRDFQKSQYNRATQARRQPGSVFKPFVYATALKEGYTPATIISDEPIKKYSNDGSWNPKNFDNTTHGLVSLREALSQSMNLATVNLAYDIGLEKISELARECGLKIPDNPKPSMVLGSYECSLLEITAAYLPFQNGGAHIEPLIIETIQDAKGDILEHYEPYTSQILSTEQSFLMTSMLQSVFETGTAKDAKNRGWNSPSAGKTGTTNDGRDAWFIGYTPQLLTGVWMGDDDAKAINASGSHDALPIWISFMKEATHSSPPQEFERPNGLIRVKIDPASGLLAVSGCPLTIEENFISGTEPTALCDQHSTGITGWFKKLFGQSK